MRETVLAKRYAEAFLSHAKDAGLGQGIAVRELAELKILLYQNADLYDFLRNEEFLYTEKCGMIDKALAHLSGETREFLKLLLDKGRIKSLIDICDYVRVNYSHPGSLDALLKTSYPLDLDLIAKVKDKMEAKLGKKLRLHIELDAALLGGIQLTVGNKVFDGSIRKRLYDLRQKLMTLRIA